jgi:uncharacterized membrane protein YesL
MTSEHWVARTYAACATIAWCCALNVLWLAFTLLGGVVLGIGPATVAACVLARRRMRGEAAGARAFAATWRREFLRGSAVVLPVAGLALLLLLNASFFAALGPVPGAGAARLATLAALVAVVAVLAWVGPLYAHYDLPLRSYPLKALRFALARPAPTVLLLLVLAALAFASAAAPVLPLTVSVGAWLHTSTWLCVRFFQENEARLAEAARRGGHSAPDTHDRLVRGLPSQPVQLR